MRIIIGMSGSSGVIYGISSVFSYLKWVIYLVIFLVAMHNAGVNVTAIFAASAVLKSAPIFPGFSMPSAIKIRGALFLRTKKQLIILFYQKLFNIFPPFS